jgi:hypothetical protein
MLGKFIAFKGPRSKRVELVNGSFTLLPSDYVEVFKAKVLHVHVYTCVCVCKVVYVHVYTRVVVCV